ncbi:integrase [Streptomyces sp. Tue6028]
MPLQAVTLNDHAHVVQDTRRKAVSPTDRLLTRRLQREQSRS